LKDRACSISPHLRLKTKAPISQLIHCHLVVQINQTVAGSHSATSSLFKVG
jgi:hypothetical protein